MSLFLMALMEILSKNYHKILEVKHSFNVGARFSIKYSRHCYYRTRTEKDTEEIEDYNGGKL